MIELVEALGIYNAFYCLIYLVAAVGFLHRPLFAVSLAPFVIVMLLPESIYSSPSVVAMYCSIGFIYLFFSVVCMFIAKFAVSISMSAMAIYSFIFALDGWVNSNVETWIYTNHEIIVAGLHLFIIGANSQRLCKWVVDASYFCVCGLRSGQGDIANARCCSRREGS